MMCEHAKQRVTFGDKLADRQAIQWWVADTATRIHACRLMVLRLRRKTDRGEDVRQEASMIKVFATEMAYEACRPRHADARRARHDPGIAAAGAMAEGAGDADV